MEDKKPMPDIYTLSVKGLDRNVVGRIGVVIGADLIPGATIALYGRLGAGKTFMIQSICEGLGVREPVTSPSFSIVNRYCGRCPVYHVDLYRLEDQGDLAEIGLEEMMGGEAVCLIEWPEKASGYLVPPRIDVDIRWAGPAKRDISFCFFGNQGWNSVRKAIMEVTGGEI